MNIEILEFLNIKTIVFFLALGHIVAAIMLYFDTRKHVFRYDISFMFSMAVQGSGWILIFLRDIVANILSFGLGNSLLLIGAMIEGICLLSLEIIVTIRWYSIFIFLTIFLLFVWWLPTFGNELKIFVISAGLSLFFCIPAIYLIFFSHRPSPLQKFTGTALIFYSFTTIVRGAFIYLTADYTLGSQNIFQITTLLTHAIVMLVSSTGYILIRKEFAYDDLNRLASTDDLTGVHNRRTFLENGTKELLRSKRYKYLFAFMMLDIDHFKSVNDNYGHYWGDKVLKTLATQSREALRETDLFGRLGGEEFAVILPEISLEHAVVAAERLRKELADIEVHTGQDLIRITVSIGLTMLKNDDETLVEIMKRADSALYDAKESGRNRVVQA